jgi:hypothetical protein
MNNKILFDNINTKDIYFIVYIYFIYNKTIF